MSEKRQLSPIHFSFGSGTPNSQLRTPMKIRWITPPTNFENMQFFRSWLVYDSDMELTRSRSRINWNVIAGLALMTSVSAAGWTGVALLVASLWK